MRTLKMNYKLTSIASMIAFGAIFSCQVENEDSISNIEASEQTELGLTAQSSSVTNCTSAGQNSERLIDIANPVNVGKNDDRTCYSNYFETKVGGVTYGNYNIASGSNQFGSRLQPRIERSLDRSNSNSGSYVQFKGDVRILEVGDAGSDGLNGTYIAQAKGQHAKRPGAATNDGPRDPAICLFLAKPVYGIDRQGRRTQTSFDIFREQIITRGGSGADGRDVVFLTNIKKGRATAFELKVGFRTSNGEKVHYANAKIGGKNYFWNIPEAERGTQSGIRYGAYRVKGGKARIQWANTEFKRVNK